MFQTWSLPTRFGPIAAVKRVLSKWKLPENLQLSFLYRGKDRTH
jgi:hypothetical protein